MSVNSSVLMLMALYGQLNSIIEKDTPTQIKSYKIESRDVEEQPSKQELQRLKGKKARNNRGNNR